jgi:catechol 2,3-dioxygenase-like lactoylglutathione lyase family enzyme
MVALQRFEQFGLFHRYPYHFVMADSPSAPLHPRCPSPASRLVPFAYVADVEKSLAFYTLLGFRGTGIERSSDGQIKWAWAQSLLPAAGGHPAALMFGRSSEPIQTGVQGVFFYMHCENVAALRLHLLASGLRDGGVRAGLPGAPREPNVVFSMKHPKYMPAGEFHIHDPDGYSILVGQPS